VAATESSLTLVESLIEYVYRCLLSEYEHPEDGIWVPIDVRKLFGAEPKSTRELLEELGGPVSCEALMLDIEEDIDREWVQPDGLDDPIGIRLLASWEDFCKEIQKGPRFLRNRKQRQLNGHSLSDVLGFLDVATRQLQTEFVHQLEPGQALSRARESKEHKPYTTGDELGSPPPDKAGPQRLSAAGVSCFYAAESNETAVAEIRASAESEVAIGEWTTLRRFSYIDLTLDRPLPSIFDPVGRRLRRFMPFLEGFQRAIAKPKDKTIGDANSYLGSQVFGEYIRYHFRPRLGTESTLSDIRPMQTREASTGASSVLRIVMRRQGSPLPIMRCGVLTVSCTNNRGHASNSRMVSENADPVLSFWPCWARGDGFGQTIRFSDRRTHSRVRNACRCPKLGR